MAARRKPRNIDPRALEAGVRSYRAVFQGEHGKHVLLDLQSLCEAMPELTTFEAMADLERTDHDRYRDRVAKVGVYRHIMNALEFTDDDIEQYAREFRARMEPEGGI